ncbi:MAG TPA: T6SS immunity protein Tli4 family protein [Telluria sp.]
MRDRSEVAKMTEWFSFEINAYTGGHGFKLSDKAADEARAASGEAWLASLRLRGEDEIPTVPGFCIWRGVFADPLPAHTNEHMDMRLDLPGHADISVTLASIAGAKPGAGWLASVAQTNASTSAELLQRMSKLREGKRTINGIDGEEVPTRAREHNFTTTCGLNWESRGVGNDPLRPCLALELQTGISDRPGAMPIDTSLHEEALLALWDSVSSSIRVRKNDPPSPCGPPPEPKGPTPPSHQPVPATAPPAAI